MITLSQTNQLYMRSGSSWVQNSLYMRYAGNFISVWPEESGGGGFATASQYLRPDADVSNTNWTPSTGATLFGVVDEEPFSDTDYIICANNVTATATLGLPTATPLSGGTKQIRWRGRKDAAAGNDRTVTVHLYEGATLVQSVGPQSLTETWTGYTASITNAVSDYTDLRIQVDAGGATGGGPSGRRQAWVSYIVLDLLI